MKANKLDFYVTSKHEQPLLGFNACRELNLLQPVDENFCTATISSSPEAEQCVTEAEIIVEYPDLFDGIVGELEGLVHFETDPNVPPVQMSMCRLPIGVGDKIESELKRLEREDIITSVDEPSSCISALLVVMNPDGRVSICLDTKPLNKALKRSHYRIPTIEDVLAKLTAAKVLSTVDAKDGYRLAFETRSTIESTNDVRDAVCKKALVTSTVQN